MNWFSQATPVFILGLPRSGATLFQSLLDGHPQLLSNIGDSKFMGGFWRNGRWRKLASRREIAIKTICHAFRPDGVYYKNLLSHIPNEKFFDGFDDFLDKFPKQPKHYLEAFFFALAHANNMDSSFLEYWVDKEPAGEFFLKRYSSWWPRAKYIHLIRDPRNVYASYKKRDTKNHRPITSIPSFAFAWSKSVRQAVKYQKRVGEENYYILRYEDLITDVTQ